MGDPVESLTLADTQRTRARERPGGPPGAGDLVLGRYRLRECLGAGGFGVVWRAQDEVLHREVAVKRVPLPAEHDSDRASREALATARLAHPAIVALYEAFAAHDAFYLISELVHGRTLAQLIAARELSDEEVFEIGVALACALAHAHARGVIHRDIKPQNVLVPDHRDERVGLPEGAVCAAKLTDFGGASLAGEDALTRTGDILGTLAYMAPEQSEGREVGEEADLYALALVLYEALCGVNPVRGATPAATVRLIGRPITELGRRRRDLPRRLTRALDGALAPRPHERGTLEELRLVLEGELEPAATRPPDHALPDQAPPDDSLPHHVLPDHALPHHALPHRAPPTRAGRGNAYPGGSLRGGVARGEPPPRREVIDEHHAEEPRHRPGLLRAGWIACAVAAIVWEAMAGRPGACLLVLAAVLPLALPAPGRSGRGGEPLWPMSTLAPLLGLAGLAGAFPAIAGQTFSWSRRAATAALGYWWLILAEPLVGRKLWLGAPAGTPARTAWEGSISTAAVHVVGPLLSLGVLLGAALWAAGSLVLPWIVRGRSAALDVVAATGWSAALAVAAPLLDSGVSVHAAHLSPRGAVLGAALGAIIAVAARALRGPV
jgi:serine/threonine protein kinase